MTVLQRRPPGGQVRRPPDEIRLVHRHYPLRRNDYALAYAVMAHCAGRQKRFWEANDILYPRGRQKNPVRPEELADAIGLDYERLLACMVGEDAKSAVLKDIAAGREWKLKRTPTYVIGGRAYPGASLKTYCACT